LGVPLIERVIRSAIAAGADEFYVVVGHRGSTLTNFLHELAPRLDRSITVIENGNWDKLENGGSVLKARDFLTGPFLLLMADHLLEPDIVRSLISQRPSNGDIALAVDGDLNNPLADMTDVTRVSHSSGKVTEIGKGLVRFNAFDTGAFYCSDVLFDALEYCDHRGDTSLSAAVSRLADQGRVLAVDVTGRTWIDVDDQAALKKAESLTMKAVRGKMNDGPVSTYLNRPLSTLISRVLSRYPISPNQISLISFLASAVAAGLFAVGSYPTLIAGGLVAQFASILDGSDGEVARLKYQGSDYGGWLDSVLDRYADALLLFGLTWHLFVNGSTDVAFIVGFGSIAGSLVLSYTAQRYDAVRGAKTPGLGSKKGLRLGRDVRVLVILIGALTNQVLVTLAVIAVTMNLEVIRRLVVGRGHE
jgi:CDP-L-myo-inositol myo-inositolphosphotransferase